MLQSCNAFRVASALRTYFGQTGDIRMSVATAVRRFVEMRTETEDGAGNCRCSDLAWTAPGTACGGCMRDPLIEKSNRPRSAACERVVTEYNMSNWAAPEITPKMILDLLSRCWKEQRGSDLNMPSWEEFVADCGQSREGRQTWRYNVEQLLWLKPSNGSDTDLDDSTIKRIQNLVMTVLEPPRTAAQSSEPPAFDPALELGVDGVEGVAANELNLNEC